MGSRTAAVVTALVIAVAACSGDDDDGGTVRAEAPVDLELRPVLEVLPPDAPEGDDVLTERVGSEVVTRYRVGPSAVTVRITEARAHLEETQSSWIVIVTFADDTTDRFNEVAEGCFDARRFCPNRQMAIVYDGEVLSAPSIEQPGGFGNEIAISAAFSEREAKDLAAALDP